MPSVKDNKCPKGHSYTEENTYVTPQGYRQCRTCHRARMKVRRPATGIGPGGLNAAKTECPKGHPYNEENTITYIIKKTGKPKRACRACARANGVVQNVKRYGITVEQFETLLSSQNNSCSICSRKFWDEVPGPHIDHNHSCCPEQQKSCGKCIRGLLCASCNFALGALLDNPDWFTKGAKYLQLGAVEF